MDVLLTNDELLEKSSLPRSTFYYRKKKLGMAPDEKGFYYLEDLEILNQLDNFLKRVPGASIETFLKIYQRSSD